MSKIRDIDAYEAAPSPIRDLYKFYQKLPRDRLEGDPSVIDLERGLDREQQAVVHVAGTVPRMSLEAAYRHLGTDVPAHILAVTPEVLVYEADNLPGKLSKLCPVFSALTS